MHNKQRGEVMLELGGQQLVLRPTYEMMVHFEALAGTSLLKVYGKCLNGDVPIDHVAALVYTAHKAADPTTKLSLKDIQQMIFKDGPGIVLTQGMKADDEGSLSTLTMLLTNAVLGSDLAQEETAPTDKELEEAKKHKPSTIPTSPPT